MTYFAYSNSPYTIRPDLPEAFRYTWKKFAGPGTWYTGAERVEIAQEVRAAENCDLCKRRKQALSPFSVEGEHTSPTALASAAVDVVHRLTTDASRLTKSWLDDCVRQGVSLEQYVEILSIVVGTVSIDSFHTALGFPLEPLPQPEIGEPSHYRPAQAKPGDAWVPMIDVNQVSEQDADMYSGMKQNANVITAMSLVPDAVRLLRTQSKAMYLDMKLVPQPDKNGGRALSRPQIELIAGRVSAINDCFY